jgi:hypothetical protein
MENSTFPSPGEDLEHFEHGEYLQYFGPTWWLWDEEGFDILPEVGKSLDKFYKSRTIRPVVIDRTTERIFEARYEFPKYRGMLKYGSAVFVGGAIGFVDFVIGIPYGCMERIGIVGEESDSIIGVPDGPHSAPPLLEDLFREKEGMESIYNLVWLDYENTKSFAPSLGVLPELENHWWFRINLVGYNEKYPVPGEFMALVPFLFPNEAWGWQQTNPGVFSGNWLETVFYTSGVVLGVLENGTYTVQYRKNNVRAVSSDWAEYVAGDRATILKEVDSTAQSFTWEDLENYKEDEWVLAPITFYE